MDRGSIRGLCFVNLDIFINERTVLPSLKPKVYRATTKKPFPTAEQRLSEPFFGTAVVGRRLGRSHGDKGPGPINPDRSFNVNEKTLRPGTHRFVPVGPGVCRIIRSMYQE